ncbi:hypothetical protein G9A89_008397 [Geosiphon pyriformis]|nr:hypothetical protein G9A89_008397 [Geosiphon pyriformis]
MEVFLPLLWQIFYDLLLCEVKKHEQLYGYKMCLKFYTKFGRPDPNNNRTLFFAAGVFVDNTIWIKNCLIVIQNILNIASVWKIELFISRSKISVTKRDKSHHYLEIFLLTEDLFKPSLAKVHIDVKFFSNMVLRKAITKKQLLYLVSAVLQPIGLKFKINLPRNFSSVVLHYLELYGIKPFEQVFTKNLIVNLVNFSSQLDVLTPSLFSASATSVLILCNTSLGGAFFDVFQTGTDVLILDVLGLDGYLGTIITCASFGTLFADRRSLTLKIQFLLDNGMAVVSCLASTKIFCDIGFVSKHLLAFKHGSIDVYTDGSVRSLELISVCGGTAAYFLNADVSVDMKVLGLLSSILMKLQAIILALKCVKKHSNIIENEQADFFANAAVFSKSTLPLSISYCFFRVENRSVFGNAYHFTRSLFNTINFVSWESKCSAGIIDVGVASKIDAVKFFGIWHSNDKIHSSFTSSSLVSLQSYLMKTLYCHLLVAIKKRLYNPKYFSMACIRYGMAEDSDYLFLCTHNNNTRKDLLVSISTEWYELAGDSAVGSKIVQSLHKTELSGNLYILLAKRFVLKSWIVDAILCLGSDFGGSLIVKLVHSLAESHRFNILLPVTKLKTFYKKHNLLPYNKSTVLLVASLSDVWTVEVSYSFNIRLGIYMCFGLCHWFGLQFLGQYSFNRSYKYIVLS